VQAKTGDRVQLPLLKEVGWAVIDYIRHGRPDSDWIWPEFRDGNKPSAGPHP
jgi:hypothetical protein